MYKSTQLGFLTFLVLLFSTSVSANSGKIGVCKININSANANDTLRAIGCLKREYHISNTIATGILSYTKKFEKRVNILEKQHGYCKFIEETHRIYRNESKTFPQSLLMDYNMCQIEIPAHIKDLIPIASRVKTLVADSKDLRKHHVYLKGRLELLKMKYSIR